MGARSATRHGRICSQGTGTRTHMYMSGTRTYMYMSGTRTYMYMSGTRTYMYMSGTRTYMYMSGTRTYMYMSGTRTYMYMSGTRTYMYMSGTRTYMYMSEELIKGPAVSKYGRPSCLSAGIMAIGSTRDENTRGARGLWRYPRENVVAPGNRVQTTCHAGTGAGVGQRRGAGTPREDRGTHGRDGTGEI
ncbi:Hypp2387 [Branchiostoma lanceolatum]|uniref:Hypp2387 protein n=1 Tax=Branchiostoma lanceolatum TaxID=7740 RepID=A0A8K0ESU5_BRALA|nr:Hypp2387 [Branchiostoma lanceolatum]